MGTQETSTFVFSCLGSVFLIFYTLSFLKRFSHQKKSILSTLDHLFQTLKNAKDLSSFKNSLEPHSPYPWLNSLRIFVSKSTHSFSELQVIKTQLFQTGLDIKFFKRVPHRLIYTTLVFVILSLFFGLYDLKQSAKLLEAGTQTWTHGLIDTLTRFMVAFVGIACSLYCTWVLDDTELEIEESWSEFSSHLEHELEKLRLTTPVPVHVNINVEDTVGPIMKGLATQLELFAEKSHGSLKKNLEEFDGALCEATAKLSQSVKEMNSHLSQVETLIDKNTKVA